MLERDGYACVHCGATKDLVVAHCGSTQEILEAGLDPFDPDLCETTCRRDNRLSAARSTPSDPGTPEKSLAAIAPPSARPSARIVHHCLLT